MRRPSWQDRAEYALTRGFEVGLQALPEPLAERVGRAFGAAIRSPLGIRRETVEANLRRAFPEAPEAWIARITRETFHHLGREAVATLRLSRLDAAAVRERTTMRGWGDLVEALDEGRGALLMTGHFGNWEVGAASIAARGVPMDAVVKHQRNRLVDARLNAARQRLGVGTIDMRRAPSQVPRALRAGHVVGIVADQDARRAGVWVPFFGHLASTHRGPALFALRLRAPIFASVARRLPDGRYEVSLERVPVQRSGDLEADVLRLTRALSARLEAAVRRDPGQYFWLHKRWKTAPPAELAGKFSGTITPAGGEAASAEDAESVSRTDKDSLA